MQHFLLTRFNILLWKLDKEGQKVRSIKWLEHRFALFEKYCLPSIINQTCQNYEWIVLFDSSTPERFRLRINEYQKKCPQLIPVFVEPQRGRDFANIFRTEMLRRMSAERVNTEDSYMMQIRYPRNHFVSVVEEGNPATVKGIFGHGRHYYIDQIKGARIVHVKTEPMWCEVVHEKNMLNDANFIIGTKMVRDSECLRNEFAIDETVRSGMGMYLFKFLPRYIKTFGRRAKRRLAILTQR